MGKEKIGEMLREYEHSFRVPLPVVVTPGSLGWAQTESNDYWHVKYDSSCGFIGKPHDYGWEIASYIAKGVSDVTRIASAAEMLRSNGVEVTSRCGFHIHVDVRDFTEEQMGVLLARWIKVEELLINICSFSRIGNEYCRSVASRVTVSGNPCNNLYDPKDPANFWSRMRPTRIGDQDVRRKFALNLLGYDIWRQDSSYTRSTAELRLPESKLSFEHVRGWIVLFLNFIQSSLSMQPPSDLESVKNVKDAFVQLGLSSDRGLCLLEPEIFDVKVWLLKKIIYDMSFRRSFHEEAEEMLELITNF